MTHLGAFKWEVGNNSNINGRHRRSSSSIEYTDTDCYAVGGEEVGSRKLNLMRGMIERFKDVAGFG